MLRHFLALLLTAMFAGTAASAGSPDELLKKVADRYKKLTSYEITAERELDMTGPMQQRSMSEKLFLAVGPNGMLRVEHTVGETVEIRVSDGKLMWKALPKQKVWSKLEAAQMADTDSDQESAEQSAAQDLFSETQLELVARYTGLARYGPSATPEKEEKVKFNGSKVECSVVALLTGTSNIRLYIANDSLLVLRHVEKQKQPDGTQTEIKIDLKRFSEGTSDPQLFEFAPPSGGKEVADVSLPSERYMSWEGRPATDFTLKTLDGVPVHLAELRGKIVLLDFWATWCSPCRHELPTIEALSRKYRDKNVVVLGINDESTQTARSFLAKNHPDLATLHDPDGKVHKLYGCNAIPNVLVINPSGTVIAQLVGGRSEDEFVAALKQAGMH